MLRYDIPPPHAPLERSCHISVISRRISPIQGSFGTRFWSSPCLSHSFSIVVPCSSLSSVAFLIPRHNEDAVSPSIPHGFPSSRHRSECVLQCLEYYSIRFYCRLRFHLRSHHRRLLSSPRSRCHISGISPSFPIIVGSFRTRFQAPFHLW